MPDMQADVNTNFMQVLCCECGKVADGYVTDIREVEPVQDEAGIWWCRWEVVNTHDYCRDCFKSGTKEFRYTLKDGKPMLMDKSYIQGRY